MNEEIPPPPTCCKPDSKSTNDQSSHKGRYLRSIGRGDHNGNGNPVPAGKAIANIFGGRNKTRHRLDDVPEQSDGTLRRAAALQALAEFFRRTPNSNSISSAIRYVGGEMKAVLSEQDIPEIVPGVKVARSLGE
jgi:hypothetical protein